MKNKKVLILLIAFLGVLLTLSGVTYAFFSYQSSGNKTNSMISDGITFKYTEGNNTINLDEAMPMEDIEGIHQSNYFEFEITSEGVSEGFSVPYDIVLKKTSNSSDIGEAIKLYLSQLNEYGEEVGLDLLNYNELDTYINTLTNAQNEKLLYQGQVITDSYNKTYRLRVWIDEDTDFTLSKYNNASFGLKVNVYAKGKVKSNDLAPGLYNDENILLASWDQLVNDYGLDVEKDYLNDYSTSYNSISTNNLKLSAGSNLILGDVSKIGDQALSFSNLKHIKIPSSVTTIGNEAFSDCYYLPSVEVPSSVTSIGENAFSGVRILKYLGSTENDGNNWGAEIYNPYIEGDFAYSDSTKTTIVAYLGNSTSVVIPKTVTIIGDYAFSGNSYLQNVKIPSSTNAINEGAFARCHRLSYIEIPSSVTSIGENAFMEVKVLKYLGSSENNGDNWGALTLNPYIEGDFAYSDSTKTTIVAYLGNSASVVIPKTVTAIGVEAFSCNFNLVSVTIPSSVTTIGATAFGYCPKLKNVTLEENSQLTTIGNDAFISTPWDRNFIEVPTLNGIEVPRTSENPVQ